MQANPLAAFGLWVVGSELYCASLPSVLDPGLTAEQARFAAVCDEFPAVFAEPKGLPIARDVDHKIHLKDPHAPIPRHRQYRMSQFELAECQK